MIFKADWLKTIFVYDKMGLLLSNEFSIAEFTFYALKYTSYFVPLQKLSKIYLHVF